MHIERDELAGAALARRLREAGVGVVATGLAGIDPVRAAEVAAARLARPLYVAVVGGKITHHGIGITLATNIEAAVGWRSTPELAGSIVVFVAGEVPKLHSLGGLDHLTRRDLAEELLNLAARDLADNAPQRRFLYALRDEADSFPLQVLEDFVSGVVSDGPVPSAIPSNLWRLGLLRDDTVVSAAYDPRERLRRNRELLLEIGQLSDASRKKIGSAMARASASDRARLRAAFSALMEFSRHGTVAALRHLDAPTVETLLQTGRRSGSRPTNTAEPATTPVPRPGALQGETLRREVARLLIDGGPEAEEILGALAGAIRATTLDVGGDDSPPTELVIPADFGSMTIRLAWPAPEVRLVVSIACKRNAWGGIVRSTQLDLQDIMRLTRPADFTSHDPEDSGLFAAVRRCDELLPDGPPDGRPFAVALERLIAARCALLADLGPLLAEPLALLAGSPGTRAAADAHLAAWQDLLRPLRTHYAVLAERDAELVAVVASGLANLDLIHVRSPNGWWALPTPLHPGLLWRSSVLPDIVRGPRPALAPGDRSLLIDELADPPPPTASLVIGPDVTDGAPITLMPAGRIGPLPVYCDATALEASAEGLEILPQVLLRWVEHAPYSRPEVRLGLVDAPQLPVVLRHAAEFLAARPAVRLVVDAYRTGARDAIPPLARLDEGRGIDRATEATLEALRAGRLAFHLHDLHSRYAVMEALGQQPVHVALIFGQSGTETAPIPHSALRCAVGDLLADLQFVIDRTGAIGTDPPSSPWHPPGAVAPFEELLATGATRWLVLAGSDPSAHSVSAAIPLGILRANARQFALWAGEGSGVARQFADLLRQEGVWAGNRELTDLLRRHGYLADDDLLAAPTTGDPRDAQLRRRLAVTLAAEWYARQHPDALIVPLGAKRARRWLQETSSATVNATLLGLRSGDDGPVAEVISVPAEGGDAVGWLKATLARLGPAISVADREDRCASIRREVLCGEFAYAWTRLRGLSKGQAALLNTVFVSSGDRAVRLEGMMIRVRLGETTGKSIVEDGWGEFPIISLSGQDLQQLVTPVLDEAAIR